MLLIPFVTGSTLSKRNKRQTTKTKMEFINPDLDTESDIA